MGQRGPRISVIMPVLNEARNLAYILPKLPAIVDEVVLVDGHSTDDTVQVARALLPNIVVVNQTGTGKGNAICCGIAASSGNIIVMLDADGSADPAEIPAFVDALMRGADFAKGSRYMRTGGSEDFTPIRRMGNNMLRMAVNVLYRCHYTDLCYGYNAFWKSIFDRLELDGDGFEIETLLILRVIRARLNVSEVPSFEHKRLFGVSKLNAMRDGWRIWRTIFREWRNRAPLRPGKFSDWERDLQPTLVRTSTDTLKRKLTNPSHPPLHLDEPVISVEVRPHE